VSTSDTPIPKALGRVAGSLYQRHIATHRSQLVVRGWEVACACSIDGPDPACEVGHALDRMRKAEARRFDDGRNPR